MVNYQNGKIYKIEDFNTSEVYIGSTCEPIVARRLAKHVKDYNYYINQSNTKGFITSFHIIKNNNYKIYLVENFPCDNKDELRKREGFYIMQFSNDDNYKCVNKYVAGRKTTDDPDCYKKQHAKYREKRNAYSLKYNAEHKEYFKEKNRKYREDKKNMEENKDKIKKTTEENKDKIKQYRVDNKEKISEYSKQWREANKETRKIRRSIKYTCECGSETCFDHKSRHERTKKHINFINNQ